MLLLCTLRYVSMATVNKKSQQSSSSNGYALIRSGMKCLAIRTQWNTTRCGGPVPYTRGGPKSHTFVYSTLYTRTEPTPRGFTDSRQNPPPFPLGSWCAGCTPDHTDGGQVGNTCTSYAPTAVGENGCQPGLTAMNRLADRK